MNKFASFIFFIAIWCVLWASHVIAFNPITNAVIADVATSIINQVEEGSLWPDVLEVMNKHRKDANSTLSKTEQIKQLISAGFYGYYDEPLLANLPQNVILQQQINGHTDNAIFSDFDKLGVPYIPNKLDPSHPYTRIPPSNAAYFLSHSFIRNYWPSTSLWARAQNSLTIVSNMHALQSPFNCIIRYDGLWNDNYGKEFPIYYKSPNNVTYTDLHTLFSSLFDAPFITTPSMRYSSNITTALSKSQLRSIHAESAKIIEMFPVEYFNLTNIQIPETTSQKFLESHFRDWGYQTYLQAIKISGVVLNNPPMSVDLQKELGIYIENPPAGMPERRQIPEEQIQFFKYLLFKNMALSAYRLAMVLMKTNTVLKKGDIPFSMGGVATSHRTISIILAIIIVVALLGTLKAFMSMRKYKNQAEQLSQDESIGTVNNAYRAL